MGAGAVIVAALIAIGAFVMKGGIVKHPLEFQKGMGYVSWAKESYATEESFTSIEAVKKLGADHMSVLVTWYQTTCWSGDIRPTEITPSDASIAEAIRKAHAAGLKVMLKPHLDILDQSDGSWRGEIGCLKEAEWADWFKKYGEYILHYAEMAQKEKVELYCIGTELNTSATTRPNEWRELIRKVRAKYRGQLTYASHWDTYMDIRFWDALDYVGINAYFPLSEKLQPTADELRAGWVKWVEEMEAFQKQVNMPIIFPEIGSNSCDGAAIRPWEHVPDKEVNLGLQKDYYEVLSEIFFNKEWFYGVYWWYWGTNVNMGGQYNRGFTPQNKPAVDVVKKWYSNPVSRPRDMVKK
jgi:hypothetical protein